MKKIVFTLAILYTVLSIECDEGYYEATDNLDDQICVQCRLGCTFCYGLNDCGKWDNLVGVQVQANYDAKFFCYDDVNRGVSLIGYNSQTGRCDRCKDGCTYCLADYDVCLGCKAGWEYNQLGRNCLKAETGLAATILAVTIIFTAITIFACVTSKK